VGSTKQKKSTQEKQAEGTLKAPSKGKQAPQAEQKNKSTRSLRQANRHENKLETERKEKGLGNLAVSYTY